MCVVQLFLNLPCPGCGLLHSFWALLNLDFGRAFSFFPVWPAVILYFLVRRRRYTGEVFLVCLFSQWFVRIAASF